MLMPLTTTLNVQLCVMHLPAVLPLSIRVPQMVLGVVIAISRALSGTSSLEETLWLPVCLFRKALCLLLLHLAPQHPRELPSLPLNHLQLPACPRAGNTVAAMSTMQLDVSWPTSSLIALPSLLRAVLLLATHLAILPLVWNTAHSVSVVMR